MCLDSVKKTYEDNDKMVIAYKIFTLYDGILLDNYQMGLREIGVEYHAEGYHNTIPKYYLGFHAYTSLRGAMQALIDDGTEAVFLVHIWNICAAGKQYGESVIVGKNMRVIERVK